MNPYEPPQQDELKDDPERPGFHISLFTIILIVLLGYLVYYLLAPAIH